jgi:high-affinity nickel-transport protein
VLLYKPWRRRIDRKRLRNATFEPLPAESDAGVQEDVEAESSGRKNGNSNVQVRPESRDSIHVS